MNTERFKPQKLNGNEHRNIEIAAMIFRIVLFPVFLIVRIYRWVWDYDYTK